MRVEREGAEEDVAGCLVQRCGLHTSPGVERGGGGCSGGGGRAACYRTWPPLPSVQCAACHCPTRFGLCLFIVYFSLSLFLLPSASSRSFVQAFAAGSRQGTQ